MSDADKPSTPPRRTRSRDDMRIMAGFVSEGVNRRARADLERAFVERLRQRLEMLDRLERLICLVDRVLRITQPPKSGKIGIRWWLLSGRGAAHAHLIEVHDRTPGMADLSRMRHPVLVKWLRSDRIQGRWRAVPLKQVRATLIDRNGTSGINHAVTVDLARLGSDLIKVYESHWSRMVGWYGQPVDAAGFALRLEGALARIEGLHGRAVGNLLNAGYDVDDRSRQIVSRWEAGEDVLPEDGGSGPGDDPWENPEASGDGDVPLDQGG